VNFGTAVSGGGVYGCVFPKDVVGWSNEQQSNEETKRRLRSGNERLFGFTSRVKAFEEGKPRGFRCFSAFMSLLLGCSRSDRLRLRRRRR
jgi:hypothetical protein